ncbi:hypothetical protein RYX36_007991 [Vicia faba]
MSADVEDVGLLDPWDEEVSAFSDGLFEDSTEMVKEDGALVAADSVEGAVEGDELTLRIDESIGWFWTEFTQIWDCNAGFVATSFVQQTKDNFGFVLDYYVWCIMQILICLLQG